MSRLLKLGLLLMLASSGLIAQKARVYLENGSVLKGDLEKVGHDQLLINVAEGSTLGLNIADISAISINRKRGGWNAGQLSVIDSINSARSQNSFYHHLQLGLLTGKDGFSSIGVTDFSASYALMFKTRSAWHFGASVGLDQYPSFITYPFAVELRRDLSKSMSPTFAYARVGYALGRIRQESFGQAADVHGHELLAVGLGHQWSLGNAALTLNIGFRRQSVQTRWEAGDFRSVTDWGLNRLDIKVGLIF